MIVHFLNYTTSLYFIVITTLNNNFDMPVTLQLIKKSHIVCQCKVIASVAFTSSDRQLRGGKLSYSVHCDNLKNNQFLQSV
jgi:hypothetical protein